MKQVITIEPDGRISGLQVKPGKGVDLKKLGHASIERASEIVWDDIKQQWKVMGLKGAVKDHIMTLRNHFEASNRMGCHAIPTEPPVAFWDDPVYFDEYDDAVAAEINWLNALRLRDGPEALQ